MQSLLFSALAYGSLVTTIPAGMLVDRLNQKTILACTVGVYSLMTLLAPLSADLGYFLFLANRFLVGFAESFVFSGMAALGSRWFPPSERSTTVGIYTSGSSIAGILNGAVAPVFCKQKLLGGWPLIYYFYGVLGLLWMVLWHVVSSHKPESNRWISEAEKEYLLKEIGHTSQPRPKKSIPWRKAMRSKPLWAVVFAWFSFGSFVAIHHSILPSYFRDVLDLPLTTNGFFMMSVFGAQLVSKVLCGMVSDFIRAKGLLNESGSCKFFQTVSSFGSAIPFLALVAFVDCRNPFVGLLIILIHCLCLTAISAGFISSLISIAPNYSGTLTAICSIAGMAGNAFSPGLFGIAAKYFPGTEYTVTMVSAALISVFAGVFFVLFGSESNMETTCQYAWNLSQSVPFKFIQGVKIVIMIASLVMLFVFFIKTKNNKKMKLIHFNLRFIIIAHYAFVTINTITLTVMLLMDFIRLAKPYEDICDIRLPIWVAFFVRSTYSLCVLAETLTIACISVERILATCIKNYDSKGSKIVPSCVLAMLLTLLFVFCYVWYGTMFSWKEKVAAFNFQTKENTPSLQALAFLILGAELASIIYYHIMYIYNKRDYSRQIRLKGVQKHHMLKSLSEKYKMEETRKTVEFLLPIVWIHFISILLSYASYVVTSLTVANGDFVRTQIIYELQSFHIFYPLLLCIVGWRQLNRQVVNVVDVHKSQRQIRIDNNELYHQRMNELFQSVPYQKESKAKK
ncbi:hypothetical protein QR680_017971 [Steinernema hermaphroditum]|uniref:Major facilitator superfamily (MFS) profile domain-containing protein n=1 Tax=Steinernema hermaphroditum TaxID=289476 RepID=A0AA39HGG4_9BILA|nr:hypothetical protein QR680_017971 [Steinernema hermaphroditum]